MHSCVRAVQIKPLVQDGSQNDAQPKKITKLMLFFPDLGLLFGIK